MNEADSLDESQALFKVDGALNDIAARARQQICKCLEGLSQSRSEVGSSNAFDCFRIYAAETTGPIFYNRSVNRKANAAYRKV